MSLYFQDQVGGPNFTVIPVAGIQARRWFYTDFGTIMVTDDPLTLALDRNSPEVGQGAGTGKFRYARGYGTFETVFVEESTGYSIERFISLYNIHEHHNNAIYMRVTGDAIYVNGWFPSFELFHATKHLPIHE